MKKQLIGIFSRQEDSTFAIKRETLNNGIVLLTPVVKQQGWFETWLPIVKVNGTTFHAMDLGSDYRYTEQDCTDYINGYREQLKIKAGQNIAKVTYEEA